MKRRIAPAIAVLLLALILGSGCNTIRNAYNGASNLFDKAKQALSKNPRTAEDEKAIADAAKLCKELAEKLKAEGYTEADAENQSPEDREKIRLCREILGAMWDEFALRDPVQFNAILGTLSASERALVLAYGEGDMKGFASGMAVLREMGSESEEHVYAVIQLLTELSLELETETSSPSTNAVGTKSTSIRGTQF